MQNTESTEPILIPDNEINASDSNDPRVFLRLLMENERRIYAYIRSLLRNSADADDVLQDTSLILWDKFSQFDAESGNFIAWSFKVAFFTVQNFRRKQGRSKIIFSDSVLESVAEQTLPKIESLDLRHQFLAECIDELTPKERTLLEFRYQLETSIEETAQQSGRTVDAVYKALSRIRAALLNCINKKESLLPESQS